MHVPRLASVVSALLAFSAATPGMSAGVLSQSHSSDHDLEASVVSAEPIFDILVAEGVFVTGNPRLEAMNLPGSHDTATWGYTQARQDALLEYTGPLTRSAEIYRCQTKSIVEQLNDGLRVFDLRFGTGPDGKNLVFYHALALLDPNVTVQAVFAGFYRWLDDHPTEAVLISMKLDNTRYGSNYQPLIYEILTSELASRYWAQADNTLGTLGAARGKLTLLRRFNWAGLPPTSYKRFGLDLSHDWADNALDFSITYNPILNKRVYIEDYYEIDGPDAASSKIQWKFNATSAHIAKATKEHHDQLFISFASAGKDSIVPPVTPRIIALGNGTDVPGVNHKLEPWLKTRHRGRRFGIVLLDFYEGPPGLVDRIIGKPW